MEYNVPQIKHEAKIGGVTFPQLITISMGVGLILLAYFINKDLMVYLAPIVAIFTLMFTFIKIHGMSFPVFIGKMISFQFFNNKYVWQGRDAENIARPRPIQPKIKKETLSPLYPTAQRKSSIDKLNKSI